MREKTKKYLILTAALFLLFILFTVLVLNIDVRPIGPEQSKVGFASVNLSVLEFFGLNMVWYEITDWLGLVPVAVAFGFAMAGLIQLIRRKSIRKVDDRILLLGVFYFLLIVCYMFFEYEVVNYRPVILERNLEPSYPSSHTMVVIGIMVTGMMQFHHYLRGKNVWILTADVVSVLVILITVGGRLVSGVHWFTDIVAGMILAFTQVAFYCFILEYAAEKCKK